MPALLAVVLVAAIILVPAAVVRRSGAGQRRLRDHHRALDTLGHISSLHAEAGPSLDGGRSGFSAVQAAAGASPGEDRRTSAESMSSQAHVRVVAPDAPAPQNALQSPSGGWRPTRGRAAPFRRSERAEGLHGAEPPLDTAAAIAGGPPGDISPGGVFPRADPAGALRSEASTAPPGRPVAEDGEPITAPVAAVPVAAVPVAAVPIVEPAGAPAAASRPAPPPPPGAAVPPPPSPSVARAVWRPAVPQFDDVGLAPRVGSDPAMRPKGRRHRQSRRRRARSGFSARTVAGIAAAVVLLAAVGVVIDGQLSPSHHKAKSTASSAASRTHHRAAHRVVVPATTTTTVPPPPYKLVSTSPGISVYELASGARVTVTATAPCWTQVRQPNATGLSVYATTMTAGESHSITGPAWVRLGNPTAVVITIDGAKVTPPVTQGLPYDVQFR